MLICDTYMVYQAMKVVNYVKLKEEFDYESLCHKLENQIDILTKEVDRQQKSKADNTLRLENNLKECQNSFEEAQKSLIARCEVHFSLSGIFPEVDSLFLKPLTFLNFFTFGFRC